MAKDTKKPEKSEKHEAKKPSRSAGEVAKDLALMVGGGVGGLYAQDYAPAVPGMLMDPLKKGVEPGFLGRLFSPFTRASLRRQMGADQMPHYHGSAAFGWEQDPFTQKITPYTRGRPSDPQATFAHELGHSLNAKALGKVPYIMLSNIPRTLGNYTAPLSAIYSGAAEDPSYVPALVHAGLQAPVLLDEALASARATHHMVKRHGAAKGLRHSAHLAPAFGTYAAYALAPLGIAWAKKKWHAHRMKKEKERGKNAALAAFGL